MHDREYKTKRVRDGEKGGWAPRVFHKAFLGCEKSSMMPNSDDAAETTVLLALTHVGWLAGCMYVNMRVYIS